MEGGQSLRADELSQYPDIETGCAAYALSSRALGHPVSPVRVSFSSGLSSAADLAIACPALLSRVLTPFGSDVRNRVRKRARLASD
jgi:hypothetical protein